MPTAPIANSCIQYIGSHIYRFEGESKCSLAMYLYGERESIELSYHRRVGDDRVDKRVSHVNKSFTVVNYCDSSIRMFPFFASPLLNNSNKTNRKKIIIKWMNIWIGTIYIPPTLFLVCYSCCAIDFCPSLILTPNQFLILCHHTLRN